MTEVTLCLNMIVKNESGVITKLMESVYKIIDYYVICDTGSTDNTIKLITDFFLEKNIPGEIINKPFENFGYNRTYALNAARGKATYALLMDADMMLVTNPDFEKQSLTCDSYTLIQKSGTLSYENTRLIKLNCDAKCVGPTHEYYSMPSGSSSDKLETLWIIDIGDGGSKGDKFVRDIRLLKKANKDEPNNERYCFYLANSYFDYNKKDYAIPYYKKRIEMGGWNEEVFYSYLRLGMCYMALEQPEMAICSWMDGYNHHPTRSESIYEICKYYREKGKHNAGMLFCNIGMKIAYPNNDKLFIHDDVYHWKFLYELCILGFYNNLPNLHKPANKVLNFVPDNMYNNALSNYKFYAPKLSKYLLRNTSFKCTVKMDMEGNSYEMRASNPCIFQDDDFQTWINVRYVNYYLEADGVYTLNTNGSNFGFGHCKVVTVNKLYREDNKIVIEHIPTKWDNMYVGIEDVRVGYNDGLDKCMFVGTTQTPCGKLGIGYGEYHFDKPGLEWKVVPSPFNKGCEKNWVMLKNRLIYQWYPLIVGEIVTNEDEYKLEIVKTIPTSPFFRHARGSTNGFIFNNQAWFLCHVVEYSNPREYYHFLVVLDPETFNVKRWSNLFKFGGEKIEYALGLIVTETEIMVSYSTWDRDACVGVFDKKKIEEEMFT